MSSTDSEIIDSKAWKPNSKDNLSGKITMRMSRMKHFLEVIAITIHMIVLLPLRFIVGFFLLHLIFKGGIAGYISLLYCLFLFIDYGIQERGGRRWNWFLNSAYFRLLKSYFPVKVHLTCNLSPDKNYLMIHHPHGVLYFGLFAGMTGFNKFNLKSYICTLNYNFFCPWTKEYLLACGMVGVSEKSLKFLLNNANGGNVVSLIPGGAAEAGLTQPREYRIILKHRKGFCRVALETGAAILPAFTFGEVDVLEIVTFPKDSLIRNIQEWVKNATMTYPVIYKGSWPLSYWWTIPKRLPINIVVGEPIMVEKTLKPTKEEIKTLHETYMRTIKQLFDKHKTGFLKDPNTNLIIE